MDAPRLTPHLIHPYHQLESNLFIKKICVQIAFRLDEMTKPWTKTISQLILGTGVLLSSAAFHPSLKGSRIGSGLLAGGLILSGFALSTLYANKIGERLFRDDKKIEALAQKGRYEKAVSLARYCFHFTKALGLDCGFDAMIKTNEDALLTKGRRFYLYNSDGKYSRKFAAIAAGFTLEGMYLRDAKAVLDSGNILDDRVFLNTPIRRSNVDRPTFIEIPLHQIGFYGRTFPTFTNYTGVVIHDLPEHQTALLDYVDELKKKGLSFETLYFIYNPSSRQNLQVPVDLWGIKTHRIRHDGLHTLTGSKYLFVTGAPYVPQADLLVRQQYPNLKFETIGELLPNVTQQTYSEQIQGYIKNRPLPNPTL